MPHTWWVRRIYHLEWTEPQRADGVVGVVWWTWTRGWRKICCDVIDTDASKSRVISIKHQPTKRPAEYEEKAQELQKMA